TNYPIIEFFGGERVEYVNKRGRLQEVIFKTDYTHKDKDYQLHEIYGMGYIKFVLYDEDGDEVPFNTVPEVAEITKKLMEHNTDHITFKGDYMMAVPLQFFKNHKWPERGKSLFESKGDAFDALDEVDSQWIDAIR